MDEKVASEMVTMVTAIHFCSVQCVEKLQLLLLNL